MSDPSVPIEWGKEVEGSLPVGGTAFYSFKAKPGQLFQAGLVSRKFVEPGQKIIACWLLLPLQHREVVRVQKNHHRFSALELACTGFAHRGDGFRIGHEWLEG